MMRCRDYSKETAESDPRRIAGIPVCVWVENLGVTRADRLARMASRFPPELAEKLEPLPHQIRAYLETIAERDGIRNGRIVWSATRTDLAFLASFLYGCLHAKWGDFERWFVYPLGDRRGELVEGGALRRTASELRPFAGRELYDLGGVSRELVEKVGLWSKSVG